jgi:oligopeptide transport system permease protein
MSALEPSNPRRRIDLREQPATAAGTAPHTSRALFASWLALGVLSVMALLGLATPRSRDSTCCATPPSAEHPLGTAADGADLFVAVAQGLGTSAAICIAATLLALLLGALWGSGAALLGGSAERALMRAVDVLAAAPYTLFVITAVVIVRSALPSLPTALAAALDGRFLLVFAVASIEWLTLARVVHARVAALRSRPFIEAARMFGMSRRRILTRHMVPHTAGPLLAYAVLALPSALAAEGFFSFLGYGVVAPHASLGTLVAGGARAMSVAPLTFLLPAGVLVAATVALHVVGAHLRDALRPERRVG